MAGKSDPMPRGTMKRILYFALAAICAAGLAVPDGARAQDPLAPAPASKQELARSKFRDLHERMQKLQAVLASTKPEDSRILQAGNHYIQEARIHEDMARIKQLLDGERWDEAHKAMEEVRQELTRLLELLQNRDADLMQLMEQIARLEAFRNRVDDLVQQQSREKDDSARTEALQKQLEAIEKAKQQAEQILRDQKDLRSETNQAGLSAAPAAAKAMADREGKLREQTEQLAKELEKVDRAAAELADPKAGKPGESGQPGESGKPGSGACAACAGGAAQAMGQAQQKLGDNQPESSLKDQDQAIQKLEQAIKELEKAAEEARRELEKLPFEQQAKAQEQTQVDTDTLAKDMEQAEQADESGQPPQPTPGRKSVQQAVPKQRAAAGQLKEYKPAKQKQQDAKEDLERARDELDEALAQLRQQLQDEILRALEERFGAMLAKQKEISAKTKVVDTARANVLTADGQLPAALVANITELAGGEFDLGGEASEALKLLQEEGTTAVFPEIVTELRDDLYGVAKRLRANETGADVQRKQADIEETLALLINALRRNIERRDGG